MEKQLRRIFEKKRQKAAQDQSLFEHLQVKGDKIQKGQRKCNHLAKEIEDMWYRLEHEHKVAEIVRIEDEATEKRRMARSLRLENKTETRNLKRQKQEISGNITRTEQFSDRVSGLGVQI